MVRRHLESRLKLRFRLKDENAKFADHHEWKKLNARFPFSLDLNLDLSLSLLALAIKIAK